MKNIGVFNAIFRIASGVTIVSYFASKLSSRRANPILLLVGVFIGGVCIAEGILRYCPLVDIKKRLHPSKQSTLRLDEPPSQ